MLIISLVIDTGIQKNNTARLWWNLLNVYIYIYYVYYVYYVYLYIKGDRGLSLELIALARIRSVPGLWSFNNDPGDPTCLDRHEVKAFEKHRRRSNPYFNLRAQISAPLEIFLLWQFRLIVSPYTNTFLIDRVNRIIGEGVVLI